MTGFWYPTVAAEHRDSTEPRTESPIRVQVAVVQAVLAREKRHDPASIHGLRQVRRKVTEILFLRLPHGVVGEEDDRVATRQSVHRVVHIDPDVDAVAMRHARARRAQLDPDERSVGCQALQERSRSIDR